MRTGAASAHGGDGFLVSTEPACAQEGADQPIPYLLFTQVSGGQLVAIGAEGVGFDGLRPAAT
jgi:hypothetical protein